MRLRTAFACAALAALAATPALASMGSSSGAPASSQDPLNPNETIQNKSTRQEAEQSYSAAYEEIGKAKQDLANQKDKSAVKHFQRALDQSQHAVQTDPTYYEAWNVVGYSSRKLGNYDQAFAAYAKCLELKPDYAPAREYLGEAWIEKGDPKKAREQLAWLDRLAAKPEADELRAQLTTYMSAHPDSTKAPAPSGSSADSSATHSGTTGTH